MIILVLATAVRLVGLNAPFTSQHWIKQLQIAPIAKNFALKSPNLLWPETDYSADKPGYIEIEFQLVTWLTSFGYRVFGIHEWVGRLVTVTFSVGSMVLFYRLALMQLGPVAAAYGLLVFAFLPSNWYFSRVLMSEPAMLFFSIAVIYAFSLWLDSGKRKHFVWTAVCGALCFLVKLPTVVLFIPLGYLAWCKYGRGVLRRKQLWALAAMMLVPALAYYLHAYLNIGRHYFTVGVGFGGGMWFSPVDFLKPGNYSLMMDRLVRQHLTAVGVVLLILGLTALAEGRVRITLFHIWLAGIAVYFVVVSGGNLRQNYYQLPMIPPAAALIALGWEQLAQSRRFSRRLDALLAVVFLGLCVWGVEPMYQPYEPIHQAATELSLLDPSHKERVMLFPAGYGCLYYFDRPGWVGREGFGKAPNEVAPEDVPGPDYIQDRIRRGAHWAVYFDIKDATAQPQIQAYLRQEYRCVSDTPDYQIFDLTRRTGRSVSKLPATTEPPAPKAFEWR